MTRPSFPDIYMKLAEEMAKRSTCQRTNAEGKLMQVGCIITDPKYRNVIAVGYNGNAAGLENGCDDPKAVGGCGCIHAEANAAVKAVPDIPKVVFCTHLPCVNCAKLLINLGGVEAVYYLNDYRNRTSLKMFRKLGITVGHLQYGDDLAGACRRAFLAGHEIKET
jgi:dCMP deaminase